MTDDTAQRDTFHHRTDAIAARPSAGGISKALERDGGSGRLRVIGPPPDAARTAAAGEGRRRWLGITPVAGVRDV